MDDWKSKTENRKLSLKNRQLKMSATNFFFHGISFFISCLFSTSTQAILRVIWNEYRYVPLFIPLGIMNLIWKPIQDLFLFLFRGCKHMEDMPYEQSAHVEKVLWAVKPMFMETARRGYYLTIHEEYAHPRCVFSDNVMLSRVHRNQATFVDFGRPVKDHYNIQKSVWIWNDLVFDAKRIITVPIKTFHYLANKELTKEQQIDSHGGDLTLLYGTSRCGSTLIGKLASVLDQECLVLGEPVAFFDLVGSYTKIPNREHAKLARSTIRLMCKPHQGIKRFLFKPLGLTLFSARVFQRLCPAANMLFCHRNPIHTSFSHEKALGYTLAYLAYQVFNWLDHGWPEFLEKHSLLHRNSHVDALARHIWRFASMFEIAFECWLQHYLSYLEQALEFPFPAIYYDTVISEPKCFCKRVLRSGIFPVLARQIWRFASMFEIAFECWLQHYLSYLEQALEFPFPAIYYDTVISEPKSFCKQVLGLIGLNDADGSADLEKAMKVLNSDAQAGTAVSQQKLKGFPQTQIGRKLAERMVRFCKAVDLPEKAYEPCVALLKKLS